MANYKSNEIIVFPASQRSSDQVQSKLSTEQNVTDVIHYVLDRNYIVDGFQVSKTGNKTTVSSGTAVVHGYKVKSLVDLEVIVSSGSLVSGAVLGLELESTEAQGFVRLSGVDEVQSGEPYYTGLSVVVRSDANKEKFEFIESGVLKYRLPLAHWENSSWNNFIAESSSEEDSLKKRVFELRIDADGILYDGSKTGARGQNLDSAKRQTLRNYLEYNIGIDDGEVL